MNQPLVSVILPTYNRPIFIQKSIKSILNQEYGNIELIIINDSLTDTTNKVVNKIKDSRLAYYKKKHGGPSSARNFGIKKAKGKYITFCDDDDRLLPGKIKIQVDFMESKLNLGFCFTNGFIVQNQHRRKFLPKLTQNTLSQLLLENSQILTPSVMVKTDIIKKLRGFDESLPLCEDYDLWLRISRKYEFDFINKPLVEVTKHKDNISGDEKNLFRYGVFVKLKNLKLCRNYLPKELTREFEWALAYQQGKFYFFENKQKRARYFFYKALKHNPLSMKPLLLLVFTVLGQSNFDKFFIPLYGLVKRRKYIKSWETLH